MNILGLDTSTKTLAIVLIKNNKVVGACNYSRRMRHARDLLKCIDAVLNDAKMRVKSIDQIACGVGPGSYTGLRIGHSCVKGLALYRDIPIIPFSSLEGIAYNIKDMHGKIAVLQDARRGKFYCALFKRSKKGLIRVRKDSVLSMDEVKEVLRNEDQVAVTGDALEKFSNDIEPFLAGKRYSYSSRYWYARAENIGALLLSRIKHTTINSIKLLPNYLRITEAEEKLGRDM